MNKKELIEKYENILKKSVPFTVVNIHGVLRDLKQLDEPKKVVVPQFVSDWIEYFKKYSGTLYGSTAPYSYYGHAITDDFVGDVKKTLGWIRNNSETYARAWLDGYEVEEEKRYVVTLKNRQPLVKSQSGSILYFSQDITAGNYKVTRKELEAAGFSWVFDCPGIEIEEVEE